MRGGGSPAIQRASPPPPEVPRSPCLALRARPEAPLPNRSISIPPHPRHPCPSVSIRGFNSSPPHVRNLRNSPRRIFDLRQKPMGQTPWGSPNQAPSGTTSGPRRSRSGLVLVLSVSIRVHPWLDLPSVFSVFSVVNPLFSAQSAESAAKTPACGTSPSRGSKPGPIGNHEKAPSFALRARARLSVSIRVHPWFHSSPCL